MFHHMYIAPGRGRGQTTPWGQMLMSTGSLYHFAHLLHILKQSLWSLIFYTFFHIFQHVYSPGRVRQHTGDKILMTTYVICFCPYVANFKMILSNLILYTFLMILYMYIAPDQGDTTPLGTNFWCQQKALITLPICCKFKKWIYTHF